jgi:hypothetical protein
MKTIRSRTLFASFVIAILLLLNISPALAGGQRETSGTKGKFHSRVEVIFTKWVTNFPNMAGLVSGDAGGGTFAGEILNYDHTTAVDKIETLYHINGGGLPLYRTQLHNAKQSKGYCCDRRVSPGWADERRASAWGIPGDQSVRCHQRTERLER